MGVSDLLHCVQISVFYNTSYLLSLFVAILVENCGSCGCTLIWQNYLFCDVLHSLHELLLVKASTFFWLARTIRLVAYRDSLSHGL